MVNIFLTICFRELGFGDFSLKTVMTNFPALVKIITIVRWQQQTGSRCGWTATVRLCTAWCTGPQLRHAAAEQSCKLGWSSPGSTRTDRTESAGSCCRRPWRCHTHTHTHNHNLLRYVNRRCFTREKRDNYSYQHSATYADNDSTRNRRTDSGGSRYEQGAAEGATAPQILALHPKSGVQQRWVTMIMIMFHWWELTW